MFKRILYLFLVLSIVTQTAFAQGGRPQGRPGGKKGGNTFSILGKLVDEDRNAIPYASIAVYNSKDSTLATGLASDGDGFFDIQVKPGNYYAQISFLSYETKLIPNLNITNADINLKAVTMNPSATSLETVTIEAERPQMELKLDKRVYNIDKDLTNRGQTTAGILENIPSVDVDVEGNVSLRNSQNVRILIDGQPAALMGMSNGDALKMIQGDVVEKVEIITNPSARYDAEGEVGIINIVLKKEKKKGLNGVFEVRAGFPINAGASYTLNYRKKKFNFFTGYGLNYRERPGQGTTYHEFYRPDTTFGYRSERNHSRNGFNQNIRLGASYQFNKYNSLTVSGNYSNGAGVNDAQLIYEDFGINAEISQTVNRDEVEDQRNNMSRGQLNYTKTFKKKEMKWTIDVSGFTNFSFEDADLNEVSTSPLTPNIIQKAITEEEGGNLTMQSDFVFPFLEDGKGELGVKGNLRAINNNFDISQFDGIEYVPDLVFNNEMAYTEDVYAAYAMAGNKTKNFSYQLGVRLEYTDIVTEFKRTNERNQRDYLNLFPSVNLSYEFKKNQFIQSSYSKRISRPRHWYLYPFYNLSDNRNISTGNPNLNPVFTDAFELGYMKRWEKANILVSPYYRYSTGTIERILLADSAGINTRFPINLGTRNSFGLEVSGSLTLKEWWNVNGSFNFFRAVTDGEYQGQKFSADTYAWSSRIVSKWKIWDKLSYQTSVNYRSKEKTTQGEQLARYNIDMAAAVDVLKGNGTLTLSVRDILNTRKRINITEGPDFYDESEFQWVSRYTVLTFSYRLNQKKKPQRGGGYGGGYGGDEGGG